jgi:hypothetical protein
MPLTLPWSALGHRLAWPTSLPPPEENPIAEATISDAVLSSTEVERIDTLQVVDHLMLMATHSWKHVPTRRLIGLTDIAVAADGQDRSALKLCAEAWGWA